MSDVILRIESSVAAGVAGVKAFKDELLAANRAAVTLAETNRTTTAGIVADAKKAIEAERLKVETYKQQIAAQQEVTASYKKGSVERQLSTKAEIDLQHRLQAALGETAAASAHAAKTSKAAAEESAFLRGAASKSGIAGTGMAAFAGKGFIAGAVVGGVLDYSVKAAIDEQKVQANLRNALKDTGNARERTMRQTEEYIKTEEHLTGFSRDEITQTLSQLIRATGDLGKARKDEAIMADIARARQTDLAGAQMLVLKASMGNVGALRRLGIDVAKSTANVDALKAAHLSSNQALMAHAKALDLAATKTSVMQSVTAKFGGASAAYMKTFAGESDHLKDVIHDLFVELGTKAIPILSQLFGWITKEIQAVRESRTAHKMLADSVLVIKTMWEGAVAIVGVFVDIMHTKFLRMIPLAVAAVWLLNAALDANPFIAAAAAALLAAGMIHKHWSAIVDFFKVLWRDVKAIFFLTWDELKISAVQAVLDIIEPFSHLPGSMGKWARNMKDSLHTQLDAMKRDAADQAAIIGGAAGRAMYAAFLPFTTQIAEAASGAFGAAGGAIGSGAGAGSGSAGKTGGGNFQQGNIVRTARSQLGIAYKYGGAPILGHPTDCSGLAQAVLAQNGIHGVGRTSEQQWTQGTPVKWGDLQPGDLVFFDTHDKDKPPSHVGIYIGGGQFIHDPHTGASVTTASLSDAYWNKNYMGARRYVKVSAATHTGASGDPSGNTGGKGGGGGSTAADAAFQKQIDAAAAAAAAAKKAKQGLKAPTLIGLQGAIEAELKAVPGETDAIEREAIKHIKAIRDSLHVGMTATELAKDKVDLAKWGKQLKDEIAKNAKEAAKAARDGAAEAKKEAAALKAAVKAAFDSAWGVDTAVVDRSIAAAWATTQKAFDRETANAVQAMQRKSATALVQVQRTFAAQMLVFDRATQAHLTKMQRDYQAQQTLFDRATQAGLQGFVVEQTPEEQAAAAFQAQRQQQADQAAADQRQAALRSALLTGDTVAEAAARDALQQAALDAQQAGLQAAADASRKAQDLKTTADQQAYQDQRDALKQALDDQEAAREQAYQDQRDNLKQALSDEEALLEQSFTDKETLAEQAYTDQRAAQWQHLDEMHADQVTQFDADLKTWGTWLSTKQRTWADFLKWLQANPVSKGTDGGTISDPNISATNASLAALAATASRGGDEGIAAALRSKITAHASGGIHWRPSLGMLGDQGPEATLPLTGQRGQAVIEQLARAIAASGGGGGGGGTTIYGTFLGATERQVGRALEGLVTPQQGRVVRYPAPI